MSQRRRRPGFSEITFKYKWPVCQAHGENETAWGATQGIGQPVQGAPTPARGEGDVERTSGQRGWSTHVKQNPAVAGARGSNGSSNSGRDRSSSTSRGQLWSAAATGGSVHASYGSSSGLPMSALPRISPTYSTCFDRCSTAAPPGTEQWKEGAPKIQPSSHVDRLDPASQGPSMQSSHLQGQGADRDHSATISHPRAWTFDAPLEATDVEALKRMEQARLDRCEPVRLRLGALTFLLAD